MGARLYKQTTGLFTSLDPVYGGNTTAFTYPQDPINYRDLDGNVAIAAVLVPAIGWGVARVVIAALAAYGVYAFSKRATSRARTATKRSPSLKKTKYRKDYLYRGYQISYKSKGKWKTGKSGIASLTTNNRHNYSPCLCDHSSRISAASSVVDRSPRGAWIGVRTDAGPKPPANYHNHLQWLVQRLNSDRSWWNWWDSGNAPSRLDVKVSFSSDKESTTISDDRGMAWAHVNVAMVPLGLDLAGCRQAARDHLILVLRQLSVRYGLSKLDELPRTRREVHQMADGDQV